MRWQFAFGKDGKALVELEANISKNLLIIKDSENKGKAENNYQFENEELWRIIIYIKANNNIEILNCESFN